MIPLTDEENKPYDEQKVCYICKKEFSDDDDDDGDDDDDNKKYQKVRDHKDFMKIKFDTDDNLLLNKPLKLHLLTIIVRCIFEEDSNFNLKFIWISVVRVTGLRDTCRKRRINARIR